MSIQIATAPCSYGVFEITVDRPGLPDGAELARVMAASGLRGHRARDLPAISAPALPSGQLLAEPWARTDGIVPAAAFLACRRLCRGPRRDGCRPGHARGGRRFERCRWCCSPTRSSSPTGCSFAGAIEEHPETWLAATIGSQLLIDKLDRAAERCRERGFPVSLHYHAGTYVETPREIDRGGRGRSTPSLLGLCFDTGHSAFGGGDPLELPAEHGELVNHVHLKDVDLDGCSRGAGERRRPRGAPGRQGVFCPLGTGDADVERVPRRARKARLRRLDRGRAGSRAAPPTSRSRTRPRMG